jgi:integrase
VTQAEPKKALTLGELRDEYLATLANGTVEANTLLTIRIHFGHLVATLDENFPIGTLTRQHLQAHVNRRTAVVSRRGKKVSADTVTKELATLRACWNWAEPDLVTGKFPNKNLKLPKKAERPPFRTRAEIERLLADGELAGDERDGLWDGLFLTRHEVDDLLGHVKQAGTMPWVYPMVAFAAFTGARRSELMRLRASDLDLDAGYVRIRERKRKKGELSSRRVPLPPPLVEILKSWLADRPRGPSLFCQPTHVASSRTRRTAPTALTPKEAHDQLKRTLAGSTWAVIRGWHTLRHTFISLCASRGVDARKLRAWVGHCSEEIQGRYIHLYPSDEQKVITDVFS